MKAVKRMMLIAVIITAIVMGSSISAKAVGKFDPLYYAATNPDVVSTVGTDASALYNHYITVGRAEGRTPFPGAFRGEAVNGIINRTLVSYGKFDPVYYAARYTDVKAAVGTDASALYQHYLNCGQKELRIPYAGALPGEPVSGIAATAKAATYYSPYSSETYVLKYLTKEQSWRFQAGSGFWQDNAASWDLYYLKNRVKNGDQIVIEGSTQDLNLALSVTLGSVTFNNNPGCAIVSARGVETVYVLRNSVGVINGNVGTAYVYDNAVANFNNNVNTLNILSEKSDAQTIAVAGTVDYVNDNSTQYNAFSQNTFRMDNGALTSKPSAYNYYRSY